MVMVLVLVMAMAMVQEQPKKMAKKMAVVYAFTDEEITCASSLITDGSVVVLEHYLLLLLILLILLLVVVITLAVKAAQLVDRTTVMIMIIQHPQRDIIPMEPVEVEEAIQGHRHGTLGDICLFMQTHTIVMSNITVVGGTITTYLKSKSRNIRNMQSTKNGMQVKIETTVLSDLHMSLALTIGAMNITLLQLCLHQRHHQQLSLVTSPMIPSIFRIVLLTTMMSEEDTWVSTTTIM